MNANPDQIFVGQNQYFPPSGDVHGKIIQLCGQDFYCIENIELLQPFFMSLVSPSDHWMFISSTGGLTAGRINAESSLFPYETVDKVTEHFDFTGSKTIIKITRKDKTYLWEPFSIRFQGLYRIQRNLYKNLYGTQLIYEEHNLDLETVFRYSWRTSDQFGFIKSSSLENKSSQSILVDVVDGLEYILPYGIRQDSQNTVSNLLNAYKRNELETETELGMYTLSSTLSDMAEASESLMATTAWQYGLQPEATLLSSRQLDNFRQGIPLTTEYDLRGQRGSYFTQAVDQLPEGEKKSWHFVLDVNQEIAAVIALKKEILRSRHDLWAKVEKDIQSGDLMLVNLVASADGLQCTGDGLVNAHHFANTLFNIMRGGIFDENYCINLIDFKKFLETHNRQLLQTHGISLQSLPDKFTIRDLLDVSLKSGSLDLIRLCYEYLPLTFSRRHGDPSRPWNQFSINLKNPDGSRKLDYQGNWRDIFQNWEPLAISYPEFIESMIFKFLNATTGDGYNPYRLTFSGFEWEIPNPDDPWGNIGYWGDHQIIYLQKLLELSEQFHPGSLSTRLDSHIFVHANVPFRIKPYPELLADWHNTIKFDWEENTEINLQVKSFGTDAKLLTDGNGKILYVSLIEKLLNLLLAKAINFVPEGGIWMNTQRPEWNDANNALAGKGLSIVTTAYLYRYVNFLIELLQQSEYDTFEVSAPLQLLFTTLLTTLLAAARNLEDGFGDEERFALMNSLGEAGAQYRQTVYGGQLGITKSILTTQDILEFCKLFGVFLRHTLLANRRDDGLFHAYNVLKLATNSTSIEHLTLMLEGQVAILSSGLLSSEESLTLLLNLRQSALYRPDQHSYILYPDHDIAGFLSKNNIPSAASSVNIFKQLLDNDDSRLIKQDVQGVLHFNGRIHNERDVNRILDELASEHFYTEFVTADREKVLEVFELVFHHSSFTGRSGTFFAYEGLGSIYWHMVTKLLLATQECCWRAYDENTNSEIVETLNNVYYDIRNGIGFNKTPAVYGSFPTDPYSHTPSGAGAKQPGMTGQVKEELMTRWRELGVKITGGKIQFLPWQLKSKEFLSESVQFDYFDLNKLPKRINVPKGCLAFTFCQVPVIYLQGGEKRIQLHFHSGLNKTVLGNELSIEDSRSIFERKNEIAKIEVFLKKKIQ